MQPFTRLTAVAAPLPMRNVNTDMIFPARFLRKARGPDYPTYLFHDQRFAPDGSEREEFVLNQAPYRGARILVADENFGCGSSRETGVYALSDYGFRAVIAPSFGDIFAANCIKNGLLPVRLASAEIRDLLDALAASPGAAIAIDLLAQTVTGPGGDTHSFEIDAFDKQCLVQGLDEVDVTLQRLPAIEAYEADYRRRYGWMVP
jgi:3-isopropylmalate/(R)-2-methylmalate dehydratase small subunit